MLFFRLSFFYCCLFVHVALLSFGIIYSVAVASAWILVDAAAAVVVLVVCLS